MTNQRSFFTRPRLWGLVTGLTLAVAQFFSPAGVGIAQAAPVCTTSGNVVTCTYSYTGAAETFTVPAAVSSVRIVARGAAGAAGSQNFSTDSLGGRGAEVSADLAVSPNQSLVLVVGGAPTTGYCYLAVRCIGGFNGGGTSYFGGGGGGASDVRIGGTGLAQRVLIAAGGGGGGNSFSCDGPVAGGNGGSADQAGSAGASCRGISGGSGGQPGSQAAGGAGGAPYGGNGTLGTGGNGGGNTGGGGGGGYYGGGGGGDLEITPDFQELTASGGGGGGSNLVPNGGTASSTTQPAAIIISYTLPDSTPPVANPTQSPAPAPSGWNNTNVTVNWNWSDNGSGINTANCTTSSTSSGEGTLTLSATCKDVALNQRTATYTVKVDKSAPSVILTGVSNGASYTVGSVPTAACSTTDALSGVATQATLSVSGGNPDGTGSFTATCSGATDLAGNSAAPVSVSYSVNPPPDTTAPVITPNVVGTLGNTGWYVSDVSVSWTVVDNESTISSQSGCETQNITGDTAGVTFTCIATSAGGSSSQSVTIQRDATAPTISAAAMTVANANGWYNSDVTVQFTCADNLAGVVSCPTDETLNSEGAAVNSTAQTITDLAGNSSTASNVVTVKIDKTAPIVTVTGVSAGGNYTLGSVPAAECSTSDALSGVATQATVSVTGGNGDGTGSFTATCSGATDLAGNSAAPVSVSYTVNAIVLTAYQQVQAVRTSLAALLPSGNSKNDKSLQKAISKIDQALASNLWQPDGNHLTLIGDDVFNRLQDAVKELAKLTNPPPAVATTRSSLVTSSRALAQLALAEAITGQGDAKKIAKAQSKLSKGDSEAAKGKLDVAIAQYEDCWEYAQQARGLPVASSLSAEEQPTDTDVDSDAEDAPASGAAQQIFLPQVSR